METNEKDRKKRLGDIILERSFQYREDPPFVLASGKTSFYYFNCKPTTLDPEGMNLIGHILFDMLRESDITAAGGLTLGADPLANALSVISFQRGKPLKSFIVRKESKDHGTRGKIEGNVKAGEKVAVLDDVITTGASTINAIEGRGPRASWSNGSSRSSTGRKGEGRTSRPSSPGWMPFSRERNSWPSAGRKRRYREMGWGTGKFLKAAFLAGIFLLFLIPELLPAGNSILPITDFSSAELKDGAPRDGSSIRSGAGPILSSSPGTRGYTLRMKSDSESFFGIRRSFPVNPEEYPWLNWIWKVQELPEGGDVRNGDTNDQAIQVYLIFKDTGWPAKLNSPIIGYIWDSEPPRETVASNHGRVGMMVRYIVVRNKEDGLDAWHREKRNVLEDFRKLFPDIDGGAPRQIVAVGFFINSHHTKSGAERLLAAAYFSRA
jgi:orotate phosphoribosyltransferase